MKKTIAFCIIVALCISLLAWGGTQSLNQFPASNTNPNSNEEHYPNSTTTPNINNDVNQTDNEITYISDRRTQYDEAKKQHVVFFGLQTSDNRYVDASGSATVVIKDKAGYTLYNNVIPFSRYNFTDWTNRTWDGSRYLCGLYINQSDIEGSGSSSGELTLSVRLEDGTYFDEDALSIYDLPDAQLTINLPDLPGLYTDKNFSTTNTISVTKLEYTTSSSYDGTASVDFDVVLKLEAKSKDQNKSEYIHVGYKLYDSEGIVVDSGEILAGPIAVGEATKDSFWISDLDPREEYTLKLMDVS